MTKHNSTIFIKKKKKLSCSKQVAANTHEYQLNSLKSKKSRTQRRYVQEHVKVWAS